ncbi:MAG: plastocyanin/azurin family copper-binding protein [Longimicrobiales bacterium]|nr:plastocyanin/azurin family copper-binding protein [Longimicrobiales bacterium]
MYWNLSGVLALVLLAGMGAALPGPSDGPRPSEVRHDPLPAVRSNDVVVSATPAPDRAPVLEGTIEGVLKIRTRPPRRTVDRYGASPAVAEVQEIPAVVFIAGRLGSTPATRNDAVMAQQDTAFSPPLLVVPVGTTVRFPNQDPFFHNVFSYSSAARFDLGRYPMGESKSVTFDEAGIVKIYCEVHESMRSAIVVTENRFWARPGPDGTFQLDGVPMGTHTLVAWHADRGEAEHRVEVPADGVVRVELEL